MWMSFGQVSESIRTLGLVFSGLWAAWSFRKLQRVRAAELENSRKFNETQMFGVQEEEIRRRLRSQQPQLSIELQLTEVPSLIETKKTFLCISVILTNHGEQNLQIDFDPPTLSIGRIEFDSNGRQTIKELQHFQPFYFDAAKDEPTLFSFRIFRVGQKRKMAVAVLLLSEPAGYVIQFHAVYSRLPFDGETSSADVVSIDAYEQAHYFASGTHR